MTNPMAQAPAQTRRPQYLAGALRRGITVALLLLAAAVRAIDLERVPPPLNVDEALNGYEAYAILETGRDSWGTPWPVTFRAFNDYRRPATIYSAIPFVALFGLNTFAVRAMAAFWGWLTVVYLYRLATDLFGTRTGLAAALLIAISPWHIGFSRLGVEASGPMLVTAIAGLDFVWRWAAGKGRRWLWAASVMFGLSLYTYTTMQAFTPLMVIAVGLIFRRRLVAQPRLALPALVLIGLLALPLGIAVLRTPSTWNRLDAISVLGESGLDGWLTVLRQWLGHLSPTYLFVSGDGTPIHHIQGYGQLLWIEALLVPLGLVALATRRTDRRATLLVLAWLAVALVPAALTRQDAGSPNSMRSLCAAPAWALLSGLGLTWISGQLHRRPRLSGLVTVALIGATLWNGAIVLHDYFTDYPIQAARAFEYGIDQAMDYVLAHEDEVDTVVLTDWISQPHIFAVFYKQYPPAAFQATHAPYGDRLSEKLSAWGRKYRTGNAEELYDVLDSAIFVVRPHMLEDVEPVVVIDHPDGMPAFKIVVK